MKEKTALLVLMFAQVLLPTQKTGKQKQAVHRWAQGGLHSVPTYYKAVFYVFHFPSAERFSAETAYGSNYTHYQECA